jgi:adenosylhomocysteine nucleosidase
LRRISSPRRAGELIIGKIDNRDVAIVHTGVGAKYCNQRLELLIHKARPEFVISAGFAGAVTDELHVGDLIYAENFSNAAVLANAERILATKSPRRVKLFTSTSILDSLDERNEIARASGAAAVDMETGAIVAACNTHGVPLLSLRAISDSPSEPFPAPPAVLFDIERQRTSYGRLLAYLLRDPAAVPRLFRFGSAIARVRAKLTDGIIALVRAL